MPKNNNKAITNQLPNPPGMNPKGTPVTPAEQAAFQRLEVDAMKVLYQDPEVTDMIFKQVEQMADQPDKAIAMGAKMVMDEAMKQSKEISPEMATRVTATVVEQIGNLSSNAGLIEVDNDVKKRALQFTLGAGLKEAAASGALNPDSLLNFTVGHVRRANQMKAGNQEEV